MEPFGFYLRVLNLLLPSFLDLVLQKSATKVSSINAAGDCERFFLDTFFPSFQKFVIEE